MIFADMGEGRIAPGVAPAAGRRQANGMLAYGTTGGLLPALPPNFAAIREGDDESGGTGTSPQGPTTVVMPTRSTTLPMTMTALTTLSTGRTGGLTTKTFPAPPPGPAPTPVAPEGYPVGFWPNMEDVGTAVGTGAGKVGAAAGAAPASKLSTTTLLAIAGIASLAAVAGLYIVMKNR